MNWLASFPVFLFWHQKQKSNIREEKGKIKVHNNKIISRSNRLNKNTQMKQLNIKQVFVNTS